MNNFHFDIRIKDNRKFMLIAFLVDRDDFISDVLSIRKKWDIKVIDREELEKKLLTNEQKERIGNIKNSEAREEQEYWDRWFIQDYGQKYLEGEIIDLQKKYFKSNAYFYAIKSVIITGEVRDMDFNLIEPRIWAGNRQKYWGSVNYSFPQIAMILDPETDIHLINKAFRRFIKSQIPSGMDYGWLIPDTISYIERDRNWYWQNRDGKSPKVICDELELKRKGYSQKTIEKAILKYKRNITKSLTNFRTLPLVHS